MLLILHSYYEKYVTVKHFNNNVAATVILTWTLYP